MRTKTSGRIILILALLMPSFTQAGAISKGSSSWPSLSSIFKRREKRSKARIMKQLKFNQERVKRDLNTPPAPKRPQTSPSQSLDFSVGQKVIQRRHQRSAPLKKRELKSAALAVFLGYDEPSSIDEIVDVSTSALALIPRASLEKLQLELKERRDNEKAEKVLRENPYCFLNSNYSLKAEKGGSAVLEGNLRLEVMKKGHVLLPLPLGKATALSNMTLDGKTIMAAIEESEAFREQGQVQVLLLGRGKHELKFKAFIPATYGSDWGRLRFRIPKTALAGLTVDLPGENLHVEVKPASPME